MYVGCVANLRERLTLQNPGKMKSTKARRLVKPIYHKACLDQKDALREEKYLKSAYEMRCITNRLRECVDEPGDYSAELIPGNAEGSDYSAGQGLRQSKQQGIHPVPGQCFAFGYRSPVAPIRCPGQGHVSWDKFDELYQRPVKDIVCGFMRHLHNVSRKS